MITCPKCNKELSDDTKFCDGCGAQIFETIFCPNCGKQTSTEFAFCQSCGASITEAPAEEKPAAAPAEKKKLPKKAIMFGGIGVAVVAVLILVISLIVGGGKAKNDFTLYLKDSEIFFSDLKKDSEAWQLTSRLVDDEDVDDRYLASNEGTYILSSCICTSEDGKYIFFLDKISEDDGLFNLYYREIAKPEAEAIKVASDVRSYTVNSSATIVTYLKGDEGNLYQYKLAEDSKDMLMAGDAFSKLGDSMIRAITKISVKISSSLEKSKIKMHIESLTKDVHKLLVDVGEEVYSLWLQGDTSNQSLVDKLETVKQRKEEIEQLTVELNSIDERDNQILGTKTEAEEQAEPTATSKNCCPNCGAECDSAAKFCRKCGYKLQ